MKKLIDKLRSKRRVGQGETTASLRITNETVAEHRERILAGGRKFKYPLQYPKYRIVVVTTVLVLLLLAVLSAITTWALYYAQDTSEITQRITQVIPFPVGEVDGQAVLYSDYLSELRSALHYLSTKDAVNFSSDDGKRQLDYQKRLALDKAIETAYVNKLARSNNLTVTDKELDEFIQKQISNNNLGVTRDMYQQVIKDYYNWTFDDYRASVKEQLLKKKVTAKVDVEGRLKITALLDSIRAGKDFAEVAKLESEDPLSRSNSGDIGIVNKSSDDPNGLIPIAMQLKVGQTSDIIEGVDGFYLVKLVDKSGNDIHLAKILVTYKTFANNLATLKKTNKVREYINVPKAANPTSN